MYPTLYRLNQNGYLDFEQVKVGVRRTRVYYSITESGRLRLKNLLQEYDTITSAIDTIISCVSQVDNKNGEDLHATKYHKKIPKTNSKTL